MRVYNFIHRCILYLFSARTSHITQLAAVHGSDIFSTYVMPKIPITSSATEITGLAVQNGMLFHHGSKVDALSVSAALDSLFRFLEKFNNVVLVGHNIKTFDCPVLLQALESCLISKVCQYNFMSLSCKELWITQDEISPFSRLKGG